MHTAVAVAAVATVVVDIAAVAACRLAEQDRNSLAEDNPGPGSRHTVGKRCIEAVVAADLAVAAAALVVAQLELVA